MFGFLLPVPLIGGVGARAALVVLILYGLLPIVRTTIVGITGIDPSIREAGVAMGMTPRRAAAAGRAAAGAAVDRRRHSRGRGRRRRLGDDCRGDRRRRARPVHLSRPVDGRLDVILAGAIPAALLALVVDGGLLWLERRLSARRRSAIARAAVVRSPRRCVVVVLAGSALWPRARRARSSSARRTSPSS